MNGLKNTAIVILSFGIIFCLIPIGFYIAKFGEGHLSCSINTWGAFGDFIGGTLNPIVGLLNLALLLAISIYVSKFDSQRQFNDYRYKIYLDLCQKFNSCSKLTSENLKNLLQYAELFKSNNQFLFSQQSNKIFNNLMAKLVEATNNLEIVIADREEKIKTGQLVEIDFPPSLQFQLEQINGELESVKSEMEIAHDAFNKSQKMIIGFIQAVMIDGDIKIYGR